MHIPSMIVDLAIMLTTAAIVTIVFKKIKLPLILGYIMAGFMIGPYFPLFFDITNQESIDIWSEIGVVIILFHIGLEFDFHRIVKIGSTAIVTAAIKMSGVMIVGYIFGMLIGLTQMSSIFLGAMLSISSTVVITKCFEELKIQKRKYASLVMGTLVMEDVFSIIIMVVLSTISVSKSVNGYDLVVNLALMGTYLVLWLILGIFIVPTFLNRVTDLMSDEMLVVLSLGVCFSMALIANALGFSMELGAFLAGSIFAGTSSVHEIERVTSGVKDLFGAVFFLSVGMMVDPAVIASKWMIILPVAVIAVLAKFIFAPVGMVLSGQNLETSIKGGISLAPIGEFSFIIASLGISLGVMEDFLYPVIVAASILTIIFTPVLINQSDNAVAFVNRIMPNRVLEMIEAYTSDDQDEEEKTSDWMLVLTSFFKKLLIYGSIMIATVIVGLRWVAPSLGAVLPETAANIATCVIIYAVMAVFLRPMLDFHSVSFTYLWMDNLANRLPLIVFVMIKVVIVLLIAYTPVMVLFNAKGIIVLLIALVMIRLIAKFDWISTSYLQLETRFLRNLNEKIISQEEEGHGKMHWMDEDYSIFSFIVPRDASYIGTTLMELGWGRKLNIYIVKVERFHDHGKKSLLLPSGNIKLNAGDKVYVVGDESSLETFYTTLGFEQTKKFRTLKKFMDTDYADTENALACVAIKVRGNESYCGKPIRSTNIQSKYHCMILGIRKNGLNITMPDANMLIQQDDILWVMGSNNNVGKLAALSIKKKKTYPRQVELPKDETKK